MGRATITENIGEGLYKVTPLWDLRGVNAELVRITEQDAEYAKEIAAATATLLALEAGRDEAKEAVNEVIQQWRDGLIGPGDETPPDFPDPPPGAPPGTDPAGHMANELFTAVNAARATASVPALTRNEDLDAASRRTLEQLANDKSTTDTVFVPAARAVSYGYSYDADIGVFQLLAFGQPGNDASLDYWLRSPQYRDVLLSEDLEEVGVAAHYRAEAPYAYSRGLLLATPGTTSTIEWPPKDPAKEEAEESDSELDKIELPKTDSGEPKNVRLAVATYKKANAALQKASQEVARIKLESNQRADRKSVLDAIIVQSEIERYAWACVYNEDLAVGAIVTTAEPPGWWTRSAVASTSEFGTRNDPLDLEEPYDVDYVEESFSIVFDPPAETGQLRPIEALNDAMWFVNTALEPGWLRWQPTWRYGVVTEITGGLCTVAISDPKVSRSLSGEPFMLLDSSNISDLPLFDVAIDPSVCGVEVDDEVIIKFIGQSIDDPLIIGWRREPRPCYKIDHGWLTNTDPDYVVFSWPALNLQGYPVGANGAYDSVVDRTETQTAAYPEDYSGLTRLLVQAFIGTGRDISTILPSGWDLDFVPGRFGCIRSPSGVYWLVRLREMLGVEVSRLDVSAQYTQQAADLNAGIYVGQDALFVEAMVLGDLELPGTQDTVMLLPAGRIGRFPTPWTALYENEREECPWRWCFRYQKRGADDEDLCGAVCVFHTFTETTWPQRTVEWTEAVLTITFDGDGRPSASVDVTEYGWFQPVKDNFYTLTRFVSGGVTGNYLQLYLGNTEDITVVDTSSPLSEWGVIASCYGPDGTIQRLELIGRNESTASSSGNRPGMPDNFTICKGDSWQDYEKIGVAILRFAGNTIDDLLERGTIRTESGTWQIECPNATGSSSENVIYSGSSVIQCIIGGPGIVLLVGEVAPRILNSSWSLSADDEDFTCFCNGEPYDYTSAMAWNEARTYGNYTETLQDDDEQNGLTILNHAIRTTVSDTNGAYVWLTDILANADTDPGIPVVVGYDSLAQSYGGNVNIAGVIYPAGLDADGAELDGRFCGGA